MPYTFLEHASEVKVLVRAENIKGLFKESLRAVFEIISGKDISLFRGSKPKIIREIDVSSVDREALLVDFLSKALSLSEIHREFYFDCEFKEFSSIFLSAYLLGLPLEEKAEEIKGVSYHNLRVEKNKNGEWQTVILFDV